MPEYPFQDIVTGELVDLKFDMAKVPPIGSTIEHAGRTLRRLVANVRVSGTDTTREFERYPYVSHSLPRWTRPKNEPVGRRTEFDNHGRPLIRSKRHEAEFAARMDMARQPEALEA